MLSWAAMFRSFRIGFGIVRECNIQLLSTLVETRIETGYWVARERGSTEKTSNAPPTGQDARTNIGPLAVTAATKTARGPVHRQCQIFSVTSCHHGDHSR